jgi:hypothetical protein
MAGDVYGEAPSDPDLANPNAAPDIQAWIKSANDYYAGKPSSYDPRQGIPPGYKLDNGQVVPESWWDEWGKGATIGLATSIAAPTLAGALSPAATPAASAASAAPLAGDEAATGGFAALSAPSVGGTGVATGAAAGAAPAVAKSALGTVFSSPSVVASGIQGAFQYAGGKAQANAAEEAVQAQREQQAWQRQQYANYLIRMAPYQAAGNQAQTALSSVLAKGPYLPKVQGA